MKNTYEIVSNRNEIKYKIIERNGQKKTAHSNLICIVVGSLHRCWSGEGFSGKQQDVFIKRIALCKHNERARRREPEKH